MSDFWIFLNPAPHVLHPGSKVSIQRVFFPLNCSLTPQQRTPSSVLLHISAGIVSIQKCSAVLGRPLWLETTHNALCCCCELLTAWAGLRRRRRTVLRSRQRGGMFDISQWWQTCYYAPFSTVCSVHFRFLWQRRKPDLGDKYFPTFDVSQNSDWVEVISIKGQEKKSNIPTFLTCWQVQNPLIKGFLCSNCEQDGNPTRLLCWVDI